MADERPQYQHGLGTIGGQSFHWGSGTPGQYWSIPYGDYPVTPDAPTGDWAHQVGAIPIANNVIPDAQLGRNRIGIMIHSGSSASLDQLYTQGCFKVAPSEWPAVRQEILKEAASGPLYLHVQPGGQAAFTNTPTLSQAGSQTPAANANAVANTTASPTGTTINTVPGGASASAPTGALAAPTAQPSGVNLVNLSEAIKQQESNGKYTAVNRSSGALGAYQIMPFRLAEWSKGTPYEGITPEEFLQNSKAQDDIANAQLKNYATQYGNVNDVATAWYGGPKAVGNPNISGGKGYPTTGGYANQVLAKYDKLGGNGSSTMASAAPAAQGTPSTPIVADDRPWYSKAFGALTKTPEGGGKSPFEKVSDVMTKGDQQPIEEQEAPEKSALEGPGPGVRNVSPLLASVPQTYGQTINSFSQPLTWNNQAPGASQMPRGGFQPQAGSQVPGMSLNSFQPAGIGSSYGVGYGLDPSRTLGYGLGYL